MSGAATTDVPSQGPVDLSSLVTLLCQRKSVLPTPPFAMSQLMGDSNVVTAAMPGVPMNGTISVGDFRGQNYPVAFGALTGAKNVFAAHATRLLNTAYTGPMFRVRRASDSTTRDFFGDRFGNVRDAQGGTLAAWLNDGAVVGYVTIWYDQSGNARHATQSTASLQPKITLYGSSNIMAHVTYDMTNYMNPHADFLSITALVLNAKYVLECQDVSGTMFHRGTAGGGCQYEPTINNGGASVSGCGGVGSYAVWTLLGGVNNVVHTQPGAGGTTQPRRAWLNGQEIAVTNQNRGTSVNTSVFNIAFGAIIGSSGTTKTPNLTGHFDTFVACSPDTLVDRALKFLWEMPNR